ncbi:16S rRNA (guanine(966)-N(2))-methyltransferase RsmD [Gordonia rhizosphera NBRC 16068]|uniref:16S rRNA (guanine(966)-N(2))-methyltransferase RsmD n=1 Tax=Gordonia rhizosphera TaxID=83341 RepID=UPI003EE2AB27
MTRIIAGRLRGRRLKVPDEGTRPTSDRVRESIFNMLDARVELAETRVLDLYAGTGAFGLEAISRGAESAVLVDAARRATSVITANARECGVADRVSVITRPVEAYLAMPAADTFDVVFLDPPYDLDDAATTADLAGVADGWLADDGLVVLERAARASETSWPAGMTVLVHKNYGDTRVEVAAREQR